MIKMKTVVLLVGPSCVGKSTFAQRIKEAASEIFASCVTISSDECRRELLCDSGMHKMHTKMMEVSAEAFKLMDQRVRFHTQYPINTDVVIVDSTALNADFRNEMIAIARENNYHINLVAFDFDFKYLEAQVESGQGDKFISSRHHKKFREEVMPDLNRKAYDHTKVFKNPNEVSSFEITFEEPRFDCEYFAGENEKIAVISDVHECVEELQTLLDMKQFEGVRHLVFCGDMFDKGNNTQKMLECLEILRDNFKSVYFVRGNHERYVYRRLTGEIQANEFLENGYFTSLGVFLQNQELRDRFMSFYENNMVPYIRFDRGTHKRVIVTHAPCENQYLGKLDKKSEGKQANFYFSARDHAEMIKDVDFIMKEAHNNHEYHVFGHMAHDGRKPHQVKNKIFLDTGCVHGNRLSAVIFNGRHVDFVTVDSKSTEKEKLPSFTPKVQTEDGKIQQILQNVVRLTDEEEKTVYRVIKGGTRYVSGTMPPAPSTETDLESLLEGLNTFRNSGCNSVVLQPKYMGSRCQVYLKKNGDHAAYSRNGFKIRIAGIQEFLQTLSEKYEELFEEELILDGELLPWAALGKGLIDDHFVQYAAAIQEATDDLSSDVVFKGFDIGKKWLEKDSSVNIEAFKHQLSLYGKEGPLEFKAFTILSIDGVSQFNLNEFSKFHRINKDDDCLVIHFDEGGWFDRASEYFDRFASSGYEGIVIKPVLWQEGFLPYMKVRNKEYLRLVYGFDYENRLAVLCKQKSIKNKSKLAIEEYIIGKAILEAEDEGVRNKLISAMFGRISQEKTLDPRL